MAKNFQEKVFAELQLLLAPIIVGFETPNSWQELLRRIGWRPENIDQFPEVAFAGGINDLLQAYDSKLLPLITSPPQSLSELPLALERAGTTMNALVEIGEAFANMQRRPSGLEIIGEDLLGLATVQYLDQRHALLVPLLRLLTLLRQKRFTAVLRSDGETLQREPVQVDHLEIERIRDLISDPVGTLKAEYHLEQGLTQPDLTADTLFPRISQLTPCSRGSLMLHKP